MYILGFNSTSEAPKPERTRPKSSSKGEKFTILFFFPRDPFFPPFVPFLNSLPTDARSYVLTTTEQEESVQSLRMTGQWGEGGRWAPTSWTFSLSKARRTVEGGGGGERKRKGAWIPQFPVFRKKPWPASAPPTNTHYILTNVDILRSSRSNSVWGPNGRCRPTTPFLLADSSSDRSSSSSFEDHLLTTVPNEDLRDFLFENL